MDKEENDSLEAIKKANNIDWLYRKGSTSVRNTNPYDNAHEDLVEVMHGSGYVEENDHIIELDFSSEYAIASLPKEFFHLKYLRKLRLSNTLVTQIPEEIRNFTALEELELKNLKKLTHYPRGMWTYKHLKKLKLGENALIKNIPDEIGNLTSLEELFIEDYELVSSLPDSIAQLKNLKTLTLYLRKMTVFPSMICALIHLSTLTFALEITTIPETFGNLTNLIRLRIIGGGTRIPELPQTITRLNKLEELYLRDLGVQKLPPGFGTFQNLQVLDLTNNLLTEIPEEIGNLTNLHTLSITTNRLKTLPASLANLDKLTYFAFWNQDLDYNTVPFCWNRHFLAKQEVMTITEMLAALPPQEFKEESLLNDSWAFKSKNLDITLTNNHITQIKIRDVNCENAIVFVPRFRQLQFIEINQCQITKLPENWGDLSELVSIDILNTPLESLPESVGRCIKIRALDIIKTNLSSLPESFGNLQDLRRLTLSNNQLQQLPESFGNLKKLYFANLSQNQLQSLPQSIGNLPEIHELQLDDNQLKDFPESFGHLKTLGILTLRNNPMNKWPAGLLGCENLVLFYRDGTYIYIEPELKQKIQEKMPRFYL